MEPTAAIAVIENDLRRLVQVVMTAADGEGWIEKALDDGLRARLTGRRTEEAKRRAPSTVPTSLLAFTHFYELRQMIEKNWERFSPALGQKREFSVLADKIEDFRNAPAHSRELLQHERALLDGIAGTIRTQVTVFLSTQSPDAKHYPVIEWARDSFGKEIVMRGDQSVLGGIGAILNTQLRLSVGDTVRFDGRGWDPQGRDLTWTLRTRGGKGLVSTGTDVSFSVKMDEQHVGAELYVQLSIASSGPYHRYQGYDDRVTFLYAVDPPGRL